MTGPSIGIIPLTVILFITEILLITDLPYFQPEVASDELPRSLKIPLDSRERVPISKILAHPDQYQMREIRLTGNSLRFKQKLSPTGKPADWPTNGHAYGRR